MATLTEAIAQDILAEKPAAPVDLSRCFLCDRTFTPGKGHGINGRFCSALCLSAYDAGYVHRESKPAYKFPVRGGGFLIACRGRKREFVSCGLRCCSAGCERRYKERLEIEATIAGMGMEGTGYVPRACEKCGGHIARYTGAGLKRRESPKGTRFCSRKCRDAALRATKGSNPSKTSSKTQDVPVNRALPSVPQPTEHAGKEGQSS